MSNIDLVSKLLSIDVKSLKKEQHEALKEFAIERLRTVATLLKQEKYQEILDHELLFSPAGDGMGTDVHYISFKYLTGGYGEFDIGDVISKLADLKGVSLVYH